MLIGSDPGTSTFTFGGDVSIDISQGNGTPKNSWSSDGIRALSGQNGNVELVFEKALDIRIAGTTNLGYGLLSGTDFPNGKNDGKKSSIRLMGPSTISVSGTSVTGAVAGSLFNNNSNPNGHLLFGADAEHHITVTSDWSKKPNTNRNSHWAVGLLAFEGGDADLQGDMTIDLSVINMRQTSDREWEDPAAGIFVGLGSTLKSSAASTLNIAVRADGSELTTQKLPAIQGVAIGQHEAAQNPYPTPSEVTLDGKTNITLTAQSAENNFKYVGISVLGGSILKAEGAIEITPVIEVPIDFRQDQSITFYGITAGTYFPDTSLSDYTHGGKAWIEGLTIRAPEGYNPALNKFVALHSNNTKSGKNTGYVVVDNTQSGLPVRVEGLMKTENNGQLWITLKGADSFLSGAASSNRSLNQRDGVISVELQEEAVWNVLENIDRDKDFWMNSGESQIRDLTLMSGGTLNMSRPEKYRAYYQISDFQTVKLWTTFSGDDGLLIFDMNLADEKREDKSPLTDQLIVIGAAQGKHRAKIRFINGTDGISADKFHSFNWLVSQGAQSDLTLTDRTGGNDFSGRGMVSVWHLVFVPDGEEHLLETEEGRSTLGNHGIGEGKWHLMREDRIEPAPDPQPDPDGDGETDPDKDPHPDLPPELEENATIGTSATQALAFASDMDDLRKRLGEVRYGAQTGPWAKAFAVKDRIGPSGHRLKSESRGINIGADTFTSVSEADAWIVGAAYRYGETEQDGFGSATGELKEHTLKAYASWMHEKGSYADLVLQAGRYAQEIDGLDNTGDGRSRSDYSTWGFGASVEVGHMFSFAEATDDRRWFDHWFLEPQLQLSYFRSKGADYTTSTGLSVSQDDADFLTGRAGFVLGKKVSYGSLDDLERRYFQVALLGGIKHEFLGDGQRIRYVGTDGAAARLRTEALDGTRLYYGLLADWQLADRWRLYAQFDREKGDRYQQDYDVSLGLKYAF